MSEGWQEGDWRAFKTGDRIRLKFAEEPNIVIVDKVVPDEDGLGFTLFIHPDPGPSHDSDA